jgi:hypothetical protein
MSGPLTDAPATNDWRPAQAFHDQLDTLTAARETETST